LLRRILLAVCALAALSVEGLAASVESLEAQAIRVCSPTISHRVEVFWNASASGLCTITVELVGPDGTSYPYSTTNLSGSHVFEVFYPQGGSATVRVTVQEAGGMASSARGVYLVPCGGISPTPNCYADLPRPRLVFHGAEAFTWRGEEWRRYLLGIANWAEYPEELFAIAPDLPPCDGNPNASRTWLEIFSDDGTRLYGFCALTSPESLKKFWFALPRKMTPPSCVYITLTDRRCGITYTSNCVVIPVLGEVVLLADLAITNIDYELKSTKYAIRYTIENRGAVTAPKSVTRLYLPGQSPLSIEEPPLNPGERRTREFPTLWIPEHTLNNHIEIIADAEHQVNEANEGNNIMRVACTFGDLDRDNIPDEVEETLLRILRPYYKFCRGEDYPPTDAIYQLRYAQVRDDDWLEGWVEPDVVRECGDPHEAHHVNPPNRLLTCLGGQLDVLNNPTKTEYYLNIADNRRDDPGSGRRDDWNYVVTHAPGLYGHVVKIDESTYKIEYWQYFAYNGLDIHGGDHEGDWATVQLWYDIVEDKIIKTCHWAHGRGICFDLTRTQAIVRTPEGFLEYRGPNYNPNPGSLDVDERYPPAFQDNTVRFYSENGELHVVVYIERNTHEFWPTEHGSWPVVPEHSGNGISYLVAYWPGKMNLGEVTHPMPDPPGSPYQDMKKIILRFNGYWGAFHHALNDPPPGPVLHCQWTFPENERDLEGLLRQVCEH